MFANLGLESKYKCERPVLLRSVSSGVGKQRPVYKVSKLKLNPCPDLGEKYVSASKVRSYVFDEYASFPVVVRCGKCPSCRKFQSDEWFVRCCHHLSANSDLYPLFVTFTFSPEGWKRICSEADLVPDSEGKYDYTCIYRALFPDLKKRLRALRGSNLDFDYFLVSEFGECRGRFHLHTIFFFRHTINLQYEASSFCRKWPRLRHFVVNKKARVKRLQTDLEVYLQHHIERNFTYTDGSKRDFTPYSRIAENGNRSFYYKNQYGYITAFSCKSFGMFKYISNYTNKCLKDGAATFRRFSPGLGFSFARNFAKSLLLRTADFLPVGSNENGISYKYPIPRAYFRKFCPPSHFLDYCLGFGRQKALLLAFQRFKDNISSLVEGISYFINSLNQTLCTKFLSAIPPSPGISLSSPQQPCFSLSLNCPAFARS